MREVYVLSDITTDFPHSQLFDDLSVLSLAPAVIGVSVSGLQQSLNCNFHRLFMVFFTQLVRGDLVFHTNQLNRAGFFKSIKFETKEPRIYLVLLVHLISECMSQYPLFCFPPFKYLIDYFA